MRGPAMAPEPPPPPITSKLPMLYYGLVVVGTATLILLLYNLIIIKWCANVGMDQQPGPRGRTGFVEVAGRGFGDRHGNLLASFSYKKEESGVKDRSSDYECVVCLSVFEEDEEVRRLPRCKHTFHAYCIDMWLYSHRDCPLCRTAAVPEPENSCEHSRGGLIGSV